MPWNLFSRTSPVLPPSSSATAVSLLYSHLSMLPSAVVNDFHFTGNRWGTMAPMPAFCSAVSFLSK